MVGAFTLWWTKKGELARFSPSLPFPIPPPTYFLASPLKVSTHIPYPSSPASNSSSSLEPSLLGVLLVVNLADILSSLLRGINATNAHISLGDYRMFNFVCLFFKAGFFCVVPAFLGLLL